MPEFQLTTPVAFIIFNRLDTTRRVFAEIAKARPSKLLVIADGPRVNRLGEAEKCAQARAVIDGVDWDCEVLTHFSEVNLGCKRRVSSGIDWVFEQVEEAIILEDDCLPDPTFFRFCQELLERYRHDQRIGMISGDNFQLGNRRSDDSYYFSKYVHIWGWASWRRAWQHYDRDAGIWPEMRDGDWFELLFKHQNEQQYWTKVMQTVHAGKIDTWDYQWFLACWSQNMISIIPNVNLISNIGFGGDATHTFGDSPLAKMHTTAMVFPLRHPNIILTNHCADEFTWKKILSSSIMSRIVNKYRNFVKLITK